MGTVVKKKTAKRKKTVKKSASKEEKIPYLGNDPFFVKKAEEAKKFLEEYGYPK